jgi:hypothetical protein
LGETDPTGLGNGADDSGVRPNGVWGGGGWDSGAQYGAIYRDANYYNQKARDDYESSIDPSHNPLPGVNGGTDLDSRAAAIQGTSSLYNLIGNLSSLAEAQNQSQTQTKQLTADDVSKGIKAYDSDKGDKQPGRVVKALDAMGNNFTATGDVVRAGVKESGVELPKDADKVLANVNSITRTGDNVVITNEKSMTIKVGGQLAKTISFTISESVKGKSGYQGPALQNLKGIGIGLGPFAYHPDHWGPE